MALALAFEAVGDGPPQGRLNRGQSLAGIGDQLDRQSLRLVLSDQNDVSEVLCCGARFLGQRTRFAQGEACPRNHRPRRENDT